MLWYEIALLILLCIGGFVHCGFCIFTIIKETKNTTVPIIGVATYLFDNLYFTSIKYKRDYYLITTKDGVYLLPIIYTKIHLYKEKDYEKQN